MPSCDIYEFSLQTFGLGPSSVEFKYVRIVARLVYAMKENINNNNNNNNDNNNNSIIIIIIIILSL